MQLIFEGKAIIKLTDMQGRIIYIGTHNNGSTINTQGFASGIYILTLENEKVAVQIKVNKE